QFHAGLLQTTQTLGPDARRFEMTFGLALLVHSGPLILENVVHRDGFALLAGDFRDLGDLPSAAAQTRRLHDNLDRGGNLAMDEIHRPFEPRHAPDHFPAVGP